VLARNIGPVTDLAADAERVYWAENSFDGAIRAIPRGGGAGEVIAEHQAAYEVQVDDAAVYWSSSGLAAADPGVWRLAHGETTPELLVPGIRVFTLDGDRLYWCDDDGCHSIDRRGGDARLEFTAHPTDAWTVAGGALYFAARSGDAPPDQLWTIAGPAATPELLMQTRTDWRNDSLAQNAVVDIAAAPDGRIYAATGNRAFEVGGDDVVRAFISGPLQFDDGNVYWRGQAQIWRTPR
jgi:hypothetical protein